MIRRESLVISVKPWACLIVPALALPSPESRSWFAPIFCRLWRARIESAMWAIPRGFDTDPEQGRSISRLGTRRSREQERS